MAGSIAVDVANHAALIPPHSAKKAFHAWKSHKSVRNLVSLVHPIVDGKARKNPMMDLAPSVVVMTAAAAVD